MLTNSLLLYIRRHNELASILNRNVVEVIAFTHHPKARVGQPPLPVVVVEYVGWDLTTTENVKLQQCILQWLDWLTETGWISPFSSSYTLLHWYPQYKDASLPLIIVKYLDQVKENVHTRLTSNTHAPTANSSLMRHRQYIHKDKADVVLDAINKMKPPSF
jgi:hypothetical protein